MENLKKQKEKKKGKGESKQGVQSFVRNSSLNKWIKHLGSAVIKSRCQLRIINFR